MEFYETEEQQVEAIKKWWQSNGKAIILGAVVGLGGLFGWRAYQDSVRESQELASDAYEKAQQQLIAGRLDAVQDFITDNSASEYASLAALSLAKAQVDAENLPGAIEQLDWVVGHSKDDSVVATAKIRLARLYLATDAVDDANTVLDSVQGDSWAGTVAALRGDIAVQQGDIAAARVAYADALAKGNDQIVKMKLDDLAE